MKIAMIGQKGIPSRAGGVEIHVEELAAGLVEMGQQVDVYCRKYYCKNRVKEHRGIRLFYIPTISTKHLDAIIYTFFATIVALCKGYDIFHYHACGPSSLCWIPKLFGKKVVCTTHGLDWKRAKWGAIGQEYLKLGERTINKHANEIIVLNDPMKTYFENTYQRDTNVIPNGVAENELIEAEIIKEKWGLYKGSYFLYLGRLVPEKGIHYLIEAYQRMNTDKKLVIAGGSSHSDDYVERLAAMSIDNDNIIMTGFVSGQALEELYSNAFVYVLPSDVEGLPISLLEAMSYNRYCLVSDIKENTTTSNGKAAVFRQGNIDDLYEKLCDIDAMPALEVERKGHEAGAYVAENYRWKAVVEKTLTVYEKVKKNMPRISFMNTEIDNLTMDEALDEIDTLIQKNKNAYVVTPNVDHIVQLERGGALCDVYKEADLILADGKPIVWLAKWYKTPLKGKISGSDLLPLLCDMAAKKQYKMFLLGAAEGVADKAAKNLCIKYPGLQIAGTYSPPYGFEKDEAELNKIFDMVTKAKPHILIVGLGCPKQELFIYHNREKLQVPISLGLGASIDFEAGEVKRAPKWMSEVGLEWFYRVLQDPKRLAKRYFVDDMKIFRLALKYKKITRKDKVE